MKKFFIASAAALLIFGGVGFASAQTAVTGSQSTLLADLMALVADLGRAVAALMEKIDSSAGSATTDTGSKTVTSGTTGTKTVESNAFIKVLTPSAEGERWVVGKTYEIKWQVDTVSMGAQPSPNYVSIYLVSGNAASMNAQKTVLWTVSPIVKNTSSYKWTVSKNIYPGEYQIAVEPYATPSRRAYGNTLVIASDAAVPPTQGANTGNQTVLDKAWGILVDKATGRISALSGVEKISDRNLTGQEPDRPGCGRWIEGYGYWWCNGGAHCGCGGIGNSAGGGIQQGGFAVNVTNPSSATDAPWVKGTLQTIRWESTDPSVPLRETDYVSIYVVNAKDITKSAFSISRKAYNDGDFRWSVPKSIPAGLYRMVVQSATNSSLKAMSSEFFILDGANRPPVGWTVDPTRRTPEDPITDERRQCCSQCWPNGNGGYTCWVCCNHSACGCGGIN